MKPHVSIIILNWNGFEDTVKCLESLKRITYPHYKAIIVDNNSKNKEGQRLKRKFGSYIELIQNKKNLGFAEGNNVAIRKVIKEGKSKYIICLNNDTIVEPDFLDKLVDVVEKDPKIGSIQPKMIWGHNKNLLDSAGLLYSINTNGFERGKFEPINKYNKTEEIFGCCGAATLFRVEALREIEVMGEYYDKDFFANYEDFDIAFRLRWKGWKNMYCGTSIIYHFRGNTIKRVSKFATYLSLRNQVWCAIKNLPYSYLIRRVPLIMTSHIIYIGVNTLKNPKVFPVLIKALYHGYIKNKKIRKKTKMFKKRVKFGEIEKWLINKWVPNRIKQKK